MSVKDGEPGNAVQMQGELLPLANPLRPTTRRKGRADLGAGITEALVQPNESAQSNISRRRSGGQSNVWQASRCTYLGKIPLFVLGAGISADRVPVLKDIANWFRTVEDLPEADKPDVERLDARLEPFLTGLSAGTALRAERCRASSLLFSGHHIISSGDGFLRLFS